MSTGFQVIGASGAWQADESFASLALRQKGSTTFTAAGSYNRSAIAGINVGAGPWETPILAVRSDFPTLVLGMWLNGSQWNYTVVAPNNPQEGQNAGKSLDWWLFDRPADLGSTNGLVVRDAAGRVTFDAYQKYLRVRGIQTKSVNNVVDYGNGTLAHASTRVGMVTTVTQVTPGGQYTQLIGFAGAKVTGSTVSIGDWGGHQFVGVLPPDGPFPNVQDGQFLIVDVTNY
ncbi:MAG: hypothetical protein GAK28_03235 [Luteibacter sp.]|uniref:hypothetical protein n=1 Tax=Luteibacter sp. TaxID=1886636 RepID=UPI001384167C|nr:hypothetical protein [Luteibacter sp.]KAF1005483.1 MAG: hypothetical protein GAK28_03235 [Luteibacter sp.]